MDHIRKYPLRRFRIVCLVVCLWILPSTAAAPQVQAAAPKGPPELEVVMMDVGQGDGIFIKTPGGKNILIDAGPDAGRGVLPYLRSRKIRRIDTLVATHPHSDHMGGAVAVMRYGNVKEVLDSGKNHPTPPYAEFLETIKELGILYRNPRAGEKLNWDPALDVTVLHPDKAEYDNVNDNSITIRVAYKNISFLFTGDGEEEAEDEVLKSFQSQLKSDVLKVAHHGSRSSSKPAFLAAVQPRYALISCGYRNSFRHPRPETLENLEATGAKILRTDQSGFLSFKTDGTTIRWSRTPIPFPMSVFDGGAPDPMGGRNWSGTAFARGAEVTLDADAGKNLWNDDATAPRWTRPAPQGDWVCEVALTPTEGYKTEGGLVVWGDEKNFALFGIQEKRMTVMTVVKDGKVRVKSEMVVFTPSRIGFRRTAKFLEALAFDDAKKTWRVFWRLSKKYSPQWSDQMRVGVYAKSWGKDQASGKFRDFKLKAIPAAGVVAAQAK